MFLVLHPADSAGRLEACGLIAAACARRCQHADAYFVYDALQRGGHVGSHERPRRLGSPIGPSRSARAHHPNARPPSSPSFRSSLRSRPARAPLSFGWFSATSAAAIPVNIPHPTEEAGAVHNRAFQHWGWALLNEIWQAWRDRDFRRGHCRFGKYWNPTRVTSLRR